MRDSAMRHLRKSNCGFGRRTALTSLSLLVLLAACTTFEVPTPTVTRSLSGPTIAPSPQLFTGPPTEGPPPLDGSIGVSDPTAAAQPNQGALPPRSLDSAQTGQAVQSIEVVALDGTLLTGMLYQGAADRQPGVLLLSPAGSDWGDFPAQLNAIG
ncbi:MAG: hypothetical protein K8J31_25615, partial [Anaerolineae bacterium]|nr:hypothetical protein [Anaerolineae bacterium]